MGWRGVSERGGEVGVAGAPEKTESQRSERSVKVDAPGGYDPAACSPPEPQLRSCRDLACIKNHQARVTKSRRISKDIDFKDEFPNVGSLEKPRHRQCSQATIVKIPFGYSAESVSKRIAVRACRLPPLKRRISVPVLTPFRALSPCVITTYVR